MKTPIEWSLPSAATVAREHSCDESLYAMDNLILSEFVVWGLIPIGGFHGEGMHATRLR